MKKLFMLFIAMFKTGSSLEYFQPTFLRRVITIFLFTSTLPIVTSIGCVLGVYDAIRIFVKDFLILCWIGKK